MYKLIGEERPKNGAAKKSVALIFLQSHNSRTGKIYVHTTPMMVIFFFHRCFSLATTSQQHHIKLLWKAYLEIESMD
jgi:hypothetical protein